MAEERAAHTEKPEKKPKGNWLRRHKVWTAVIVVVILFIFIGASSDSSKNAATTASGSGANVSTNKAATSSPTASSTPGLNQQANDGKLGFTVTSFKCGVGQVEQPGDQYGINTTSTGAPYCVMNLTVKGVSNVAQSFDMSSQYIYGASNRQFSVDTTATIDANPENSTCMEDPTINPTVTMPCILVFDVPGGQNPGYAMLHDSLYSNGVRVNL